MKFLKKKKMRHPNSNPKDIVCNYCEKRGHVKAKYKGKLKVDYDMMR